jgi:hypothetical protein
MLTDKQSRAVELRDGQKLSFAKVGEAMGISAQAAGKHYARGKAKLDKKEARLSPDLRNTLANVGLSDLRGQHSGWVHREDPETGEWASVYYYLGQDGEKKEADLEEMMAGAIESVFQGRALARPKRPEPTGENLLVIDIADLHIGKLCVASETGFTYDRDVAIHRGIEGARRLLEFAKKHGVGHILFVIGNDIIHVDGPRSTTTAGTYQDTDGTIHVMWDDAFAFYVTVIDMCREVAPVTLLYCPSNHDWFAGFTIARSLQAHYRNCPEVSASDYNTSPAHRKYFAYENNAIGFTHGDGAKEADLPALMMDEARHVLAQCDHLYWYVHHLHHKIRKKGAGTLRRQTEKDLIGMTVISGRAGLPDTRSPEIEYLRSPSAPDGWHHRNGYVNRQAVECFLHDAHEGQFARFSAWF